MKTTCTSLESNKYIDIYKGVLLVPPAAEHSSEEPVAGTWGDLLVLSCY